MQVQKKKEGWWLPWWFLFIGWFLLLALSGISTFFTLLYGFQYGRESSIQWVITLTLSLVQSIFLLQPLKVRTSGVCLREAETLRNSSPKNDKCLSFSPGIQKKHRRMLMCQYVFFFSFFTQQQHTVWAVKT